MQEKKRYDRAPWKLNDKYPNIKGSGFLGFLNIQNIWVEQTQISDPNYITMFDTNKGM